MLNVRSLVFIFTLFLGLPLISQNEVLLKSPIYKLGNNLNASVDNVIGTDKGLLYYVSSTASFSLKNGQTSKITYHKMNKYTFAETWAKEYDYPAMRVGHIFMTQDAIVYPVAKFDKKSKTDSYSIEQISLKTGEKLKTNWKGPDYKFENWLDARNYEDFFSLSPDSSKVLFVHQYRTPDIDEAEEIQADLYELKTAKKIWTKQVPDKVNGQHSISYDFKTDNNGNLFYLASTVKNKLVANYFSVISNETTAPKTIELKLGTNQFSNLRIGNVFYKKKSYSLFDRFPKVLPEIAYELDAQGNAIVTGFYVNNSDKKVFTNGGVFNYNVNTTSFSVTGSNVSPFSTEILARLQAIDKEFKLGDELLYKVDALKRIGSSYYLIGHVYYFGDENSAMVDKIKDILFFDLTPGNAVKYSTQIPVSILNERKADFLLPLYVNNDKLTYLLTFNRKSLKVVDKTDFTPDMIKVAMAKGGSVFPVTFDENGMKSVSNFSIDDDLNTSHPLQNCIVSDGKCGLAIFGGTSALDGNVHENKYQFVWVTLAQ